MQLPLENILGRVIAAALFTGVIAGTWDTWWHGALGRESFWSPPHILLYLSVLVAIGLGVYGWHRTREAVWRRLAALLALVPLSAPFDELWHRFFGIEDASSPLIVWSPPHVALILAIAGSLLMLLPVLRREENRDAERFFGPLVFASLLVLTLFLASPLQPTGPYALLGFWGAGILAFVFVFMILAAQSWIPGFGGATLAAAAYLVIQAVAFNEKLAPGVDVPPHDHSPPWLIIFSVFVSAALLDFTRNLPAFARGALAGLVWSGLLFGFSSAFFEPQFQYTLADGTTAVVASLAGGLIAGIIFGLQQRKT